MDNVRPRGSYSPIKGSYYIKPAFRPKDLKQDVKTFRVQNMTTAGTRAVVNTGKGKMDTDLKKSRWVWRPKGNYLDHFPKTVDHSCSRRLKILLQDHAVVDSGCSSHMTSNKAYLSYYEDYNGGFVAFGSDPKGDELKFNLFSVSQMCGKDFSNPLMVDSLPKTIWLSMHHVIAMKHWLVQSKRTWIDGLEKDLKQTKKTYSTALTKLVLRVKKLEYKLKSGKARRKAKIVLSDDEEIAEDSSKQGRKISQIDEDLTISLVQDKGISWIPQEEEVHEKPSDETEVIVQEETPTEIIEEHGSGEKEGANKDKGNAIMKEPDTLKKVKKGAQVQLSMDEELARKMEEEERARFNAEQEARALQEEEEERLNLEAAWELQRQLDERQQVPTEATQSKGIDWNDPSVLRYHALKNKHVSIAQARRNMITYLKNQGGYKESYFKRMSYNDIRPIFERVWDHVNTFIPIGSELKKGVHSAFLTDTPMEINMLVEKKYPLKKEILEKMINLKLQAKEESTMAFKLIKFITD
ncbi:hypothetical protein Tco_0978200 [Tanacetum coccineum]|uniref:Uncharacterized protein n=1 Tax=Tanacetum coccineum TaxID=301880 RepID=A0ABQ5EMQ5_9ASTR